MSGSPAKFSSEKRKEVDRIKSEIKPIIDSCKNEPLKSFCPYFCSYHGWCDKYYSFLKKVIEA